MIITYNKRKTLLLSLCIVLLFLIVSPFLFDSFTEYLTTTEFWKQLSLAYLKDTSFIPYFIFDMTLMIVAYMKWNGLNLKQLKEKLFAKETTIDLKEILKACLITHVVLACLLLGMYLLKPIGFIYVVQFAFVFEGFIIGDILGMLMFRKKRSAYGN